MYGLSVMLFFSTQTTSKDSNQMNSWGIKVISRGHLSTTLSGQTHLEMHLHLVKVSNCRKCNTTSDLL